jgi:ubiquinone/menaquinone biosynthesis C-methylase UbiE
MFPNTKIKENLHRGIKRRLEITIIINQLLNILKYRNNPNSKVLEVLEFGSGSGAQLPYLTKIGKVTGSDVVIRPEIKTKLYNNIVECSITDTPFDDSQFDIIFSNHVIEHIGDLNKTFFELKRIGNSSCIYAFSVPTNIWLLLSLPAQYYNKLNKAIEFLFKSKTRDKSYSPNLFVNLDDKKSKIFYKIVQISNYLLPKGHGYTTQFINCYRSFKINNWKQLFIKNGFNIIEVKPLMIYGPSEWPIIQSKKSNSTTCASVLFLMTKHS